MHTLRIALATLAAFSFTLFADSVRSNESIEVKVADLYLALEVPDNWEYIQRDTKHVFRNSIEQIHLFDSGPVTPRAFRREIRQARLLFVSRQFEQSLEILQRLRIRAAFPTAAQWQRFAPHWYRIIRTSAARSDAGYEAVEQAFEEVLDQISVLPTPEFETLVRGTLATLESLDLREVAEMQPVIVDGRTSLRVKTWDLLTHAHPTEYVFVSGPESLLIIQTALGSFERIEPVFTTLLASIRF